MSHLLAVPQFKQDFENLLANMIKELVNPTILAARIDQLVDMLKEDVAWDKSLPRVGSPILLNKINGGDTNSSSTNSTSAAVLGDVPFEIAINGPSVTDESMSSKEWLSLRSSNLLTFFNQSLTANSTH
jgi:hypothetical protein